MIFLLIALCSSQQVTPVPSPRDGFVLGPVKSNYTIDAFFDHLCTDSAAAFPGFYQYWQANQNWLGLRIHIFPLTYHPFSFVVAQAGRYIQSAYPSKFLSFMSYMFSHQNLILNNYMNWDFNTLQNKVALYTQQATGVSFSEVLNALNDQNVNYSSRVSWKYATSRMVTGTPMYLVNQVLAPEAGSFTTSAQWASFFNSLNS